MSTLPIHRRELLRWGAQAASIAPLLPCSGAGKSGPSFSPPRELLIKGLRNSCSTKSSYSYVDAFNPLSTWYDADVLGIDLGITMVMAENHRSGLIWSTFMKNSEARAAMAKAGFQQA